MKVILFGNPMITQESLQIVFCLEGLSPKALDGTNFINRFVLLSETDKITSNVPLLWIEKLNLKF